MKISKIIPTLDKHRHKGQNGKIAVIGGSLEYTGAPYYAAISTLKGGGDLAYIYCTKSAAIPIKSYSPECIVYPYLLEAGEDMNYNHAIQQLMQSTSIMNSLVIGPGLGREKLIGMVLENLFQTNNSIKILDADALWYISQKSNNVIKIIQEKSQQFILTPNAVEIKRLLEYFEMPFYKPEYTQKQVQGIDFEEVSIQSGYPQVVAELSRKLNNAVIVAKGYHDYITDGKICYAVYVEGSKKRCGGQGDILSGLIGLYSFWALQSQEQLMNGCLLGSIVTREAAALAQLKDMYSLTTPKIIEHIGESIYKQTLNK